MSNKRIVHLHVNGGVTRTTAEHPVFVPGKGWINAAEMAGAKTEDENVGDQTMPRRPIMGFVAGALLVTADGLKRIEDIKPGDLIQVEPDDDRGDNPEDQDDVPHWWARN